MNPLSADSELMLAPQASCCFGFCKADYKLNWRTGEILMNCFFILGWGRCLTLKHFHEVPTYFKLYLLNIPLASGSQKNNFWMCLLLGFSNVSVGMICQTVEDLLPFSAQCLSSQKCVYCKCALVGWIFSPFVEQLLYRTRCGH